MPSVAEPTVPLSPGEVVKAMRAAHEEGLLRDVAARKAQLRQLRRLLVENEERLLGALAADLGKPAIEAYAADVGFTVREITEILDHLDRWVKPRPVRVPMVARPGKAWIIPEPLGVVLVIAPWNYPIQLLLAPPRRRWPPATRSSSSHPRSAGTRRPRWPSSCLATWTSGWSAW